ncbi:MAG: efflux RND transporter periplasmic adaptor subunit [Clostridiaceae bacterium]|nr:efflux RND transporter periplasmic adaptor subunit [Clostridiaceae bacterium]
MLYKRSFWQRIFSCLILTVLFFNFSACSNIKQKNDSYSTPTPVCVAPVTRGDIDSYTLYNGLVKPKKLVYVTSVISGKVSVSFFDVGDRVKKGDLLFTVRNEDIEDNIDILEEQLKAAKSNIALAETGVAAAMGSGFESQKLQYESALKSAEYDYVAAKKLFDSSTLLYEAKKINIYEYNKVKNQYEQAKNVLETARDAYELFIYDVSKNTAKSANEQLKQAQASYDTIKLQLESARKKLDHTKITSPIDGIVAGKEIITGSLISNTMVPYVIMDIDTVLISISVTEQVINKIKRGDIFEVSIPAASSKPFKGEVITVNPAPDGNTFTYNVLIDVVNEGDLIKPGMTAKVCILTEQRKNTLLAPLNSVMSDSSGKYVFIIQDNTAKKRYVNAGIIKDDMVEVLSGIETGELLVVKGQQLLKHDHPVEIVGEGQK